MPNGWSTPSSTYGPRQHTSWFHTGYDVGQTGSVYAPDACVAYYIGGAGQDAFIDVEPQSGGSDGLSTIRLRHVYNTAPYFTLYPVGDLRNEFSVTQLQNLTQNDRLISPK
jgi:hypothetical protein